jgi:hypothetical protein
MARRHRWSNFKDQLLAAALRAATLAAYVTSASTWGTAAVRLEFLKNPSGQRVDSIQQVFLASDSRDLITQLAILEKE